MLTYKKRKKGGGMDRFKRVSVEESFIIVHP
jgi:hypothetical protein